jgi:hypothetical protein
LPISDCKKSSTSAAIERKLNARETIKAPTKYGVIIQPEQYVFLKFEDLENFQKRTSSGTSDISVLIVIDEDHLQHNSRDHRTTDKNERELWDFLSLSRKHYNELIFITQDVSKVDSEIRKQMSYVCRFRDMNPPKKKEQLDEFAPVPPGGISIPFFPFFMMTRWDADGERVGGVKFIYKSMALFLTYDSWDIPKKIERAGTFTKLELERVPRFSLSDIKPAIAKNMKYLFLAFFLGIVVIGFKLWSGRDKSPDPVVVSSPVSSPTPSPIPYAEIPPLPEDFKKKYPVDPPVKVYPVAEPEAILPEFGKLLDLGSYSIVDEPLRGAQDGTFMITAFGRYHVGMGCRYGDVVRVIAGVGDARTVAKVRAADGSIVYVRGMSDEVYRRYYRYIASLEAVGALREVERGEPVEGVSKGPPVTSRSSDLVDALKDRFAN